MCGKLKPLDPKLLEEAQAAWCSSYPRKVVNPRMKQYSVRTPEEASKALSKVNGRNSGYVSVYGFPRGHSTDGHIPQVDTIMYDLDVLDDDFRSIGDWRRELSELLARVRLVAQTLVDNGKEKYWRASLSGHKGVHLYQDFPVLPEGIGNLMQFKSGLSEYSQGVIEALEEESSTALAEWVDVDSSDLGRLTRHPNTIHVGASEFFGNLRWCVPVSLRELTEIDVDRYEELTKKPRPLPEGCTRTENPKAGEIIKQYIRYSSEIERKSCSTLSDMTYAERRKALESYDEQSNDSLKSLDDVRFVLHHKPCIFEWRTRDDAFDHGDSSHKFELFAIVNMVAKQVPVELMKEFFAGIAGYDEQFTNARLRDVIAWTNGLPLSCDYAKKNAPMFCDCG